MSQRQKSNVVTWNEIEYVMENSELKENPIDY